MPKEQEMDQMNSMDVIGMLQRGDYYYNRLKNVYEEHEIGGGIQVLRSLQFTQMPNHVIGDFFHFTSDTEAQLMRHRLELLTEAFTDHDMLEVVGNNGAQISETDIHVLFPGNSPVYNTYLHNAESAIRTYAAKLKINFPDRIPGLESPIYENPMHIVIHTIQEIITEANESKDDHENQNVFAWIKGGFMPHAARVLYGPMFMYPSITPGAIADKFYIAHTLAYHDREAIDNYRLIRKEIQLDPIFSHHPTLVRDMSTSVSAKIREFNDKISRDQKENRKLMRLLNSGMLPSYDGDIDVLFNTDEAKTIQYANRIADTLIQAGFEVRKVYRNASFDVRFMLYELFIKLPEGREQVLEFHLNPNHDVSEKNSRANQHSFVTDLAHEMTAYQSMRIVMDGENIYFFDPYRTLTSRGQCIGINPLFNYLRPSHQLLVSLYAPVYAALSNTEHLTEIDLQYMRSAIQLQRTRMSQTDTALPYPSRLLLFTLHDAQKALRAQSASVLLDDYWSGGDATKIFSRLEDTWGDIGLFEFINDVCNSHTVAEDLLIELKKVFPRRIFANFSAPDAESTARAGSKVGDNGVEDIISNFSNYIIQTE